MTFETIYNFVSGQAHDCGRSWRQQIRLVLRHALHFHSVHESDRRHSRLRIANHDSRRSLWVSPSACFFITTGWVSGRRASAGIWRTSPDPWFGLAPLMVPIELISHLARPLSLTIRLFANMFAGEMVTRTFLDAHVLSQFQPPSWGCMFSSHSYRLSYSCCSP